MDARLVAWLPRLLWLLLPGPALPRAGEFQALDPGVSLFGTVAREMNVASRIQCSIRCSEDASCSVFEFRAADRTNCRLIREDSGGAALSTGAAASLFRKECPDTWTSAVDGPVVYINFERHCSWVLHNGASLISGPFGLALNTVRDQNQWAMLPDVSAACIMTPDTCGGAGATLTVWLKVTECDDDDGVLSSGTNGPVSTGLRIACGGENATLIYVKLVVTDGFFRLAIDRPVGWFHIGVGFSGPAEGQGILLYVNGTLVDSDDTWNQPGPFARGPGVMVLGRRHPDHGWQHSNASVDELAMWNRKLSAQEIADVFQGV